MTVPCGASLLEAAYLLHHRPWSDTSRILDFMTRNHGRVTLFRSRRPAPEVAAARRAAAVRAALVSWSGRADGGTLTAAESAGVAPALAAIPPHVGLLPQRAPAEAPAEGRSSRGPATTLMRRRSAALAAGEEQPALARVRTRAARGTGLWTRPVARRGERPAGRERSVLSFRAGPRRARGQGWGSGA